MKTSPASTKTPFCQTEETESTILLVEDEPVVREVTRAVLEHAGYRSPQASALNTAFSAPNEPNVQVPVRIGTS